MQIKTTLRKATELGIFISAIAALILAGCGGSSSSSVSGGSSNSLNVTPGKGIMINADVVIKDVSGNILGTSLTTASGVAPVSVPSSATPPFIVSVTCTDTCSYFDEKALKMVSGVAGAPSMMAIVPSAGLTSIGVTAATNAVAQYALNSGTTLSATTVTAINDAVAIKLGLPQGTDLLTPPTVISDAATMAAAKAGTTTADWLANISSALSQAASGVSALQAIADYGNAWKQAAITPASGVIMPASIDTAALQSAFASPASSIPVTTITNVNNLVTNVSATGMAFESQTGTARGIDGTWIACRYNTQTAKNEREEVTYSGSSMTTNTYTGMATIDLTTLPPSCPGGTLDSTQSGTFTLAAPSSIAFGGWVSTNGAAASAPAAVPGLAALPGNPANVSSVAISGTWNGAAVSGTNSYWIDDRASVFVLYRSANCGATGCLINREQLFR